MDENHNGDIWGKDNIPNEDFFEHGNYDPDNIDNENGYLDTPDGEPADTDSVYTDDYDEFFEETREMSSVASPKSSEEKRYGITPRDEFTDMNSADADMSKTRCMDSVLSGEQPAVPGEATVIQNPVKKRKKKQINHTRTMSQVFLGAVISVLALGVGVFLSIKVIGAMRDITGMSKDNKKIDFEITENMNVDDIIDGLHQSGIIDMPSLMKMYVKFTKNTSGFLNGPHTVSANMSYNNIIASLKTEKEYTETVTVVIPEGLSVAEIGELLEENYVCRASDFEDYVKTKKNRCEFEEGLNDNSNRMFMLEGYLFPDTYEFYVVDYLKKNSNYDTHTWAKKAADKMMDNFEDHITKKLKARMKELGMTLDQTIILASLIQREGKTEEDMAMVSSVFHNRLDDSETYPKLESDATDTYITETIRPRTTAANKAQMQKIEEAYDTYNCIGLPVGAICNPGMDAINAALYPDDTNYYYFLAARDGTFYWAQTLEQHEQNIIDADLHWDEENGQSGDDDDQ